jgi:anti-repressor protein
MNELQPVEQKIVDFNGSELLAAKTNDGKIYAAVKWVCEGIGLTRDQIKNERKKIQEDLVLSKGGRYLTLPTNGGMQEVLCIELDFLPLWLAKISITPKMQKENTWTVRRLVEFQLKAKDVLAAAFLQKPTTQAELIAMMAQQAVEQERRLNAVEQKQQMLEKQQENIKEIVALNPTEWRKKTTTILNKIAIVRGGFGEYKNVRQESYDLLEARARCKLDIRLNNRKKEALANGIIPKSKIEKMSKLDVIADDPRLTEIYIAIVKEMAIKYQVDMEGLGA